MVVTRVNRTLVTGKEARAGVAAPSQASYSCWSGQPGKRVKQSHHSGIERELRGLLAHWLNLLTCHNMYRAIRSPGLKGQKTAGRR
jgi:hypothetical protein